MQRSIVARPMTAGANDNGVQPRGSLAPDERLLDGLEPATRSTELIRRAGQRLGLDQRVIDEIIHPHEVRVFRLPISAAISSAARLAVLSAATGSSSTATTSGSVSAVMSRRTR